MKMSRVRQPNDQNELDAQIPNATLKFKLQEDNLRIILTPKSAPQISFQTLLTMEKFNEPLKKKYDSPEGMFTDFQLAPGKIQNLTYNQNQNKLSIKVSQQVFIPFQLSPIPSKYNVIQQKAVQIKPKLIENQQLKNLQQQQAQFDQMILSLEQQLQQLSQLKSIKDKELSDLQTRKSQVDKQLAQTLTKWEQTKNKFIGNDLELSQKYGKYVEHQQGKCRLFMKQKGVTDSMIQEISVYDLRKIQILSLGDNQITDTGYNYLFVEKQWPVLIQIYLQNNKIQNIHSLQKIQSLETLAIYQNQLSEASCDYLCSYTWVQMKNLRVSFRKGSNNECWKKLITVMQNNFPQLKQLWYSNEQDLNGVVKKKILDYCNGKKIALNHSGGINIDEIVKMKLLSDLLKGAIAQ